MVFFSGEDKAAVGIFFCFNGGETTLFCSFAGGFVDTAAAFCIAFGFRGTLPKLVTLGLATARTASCFFLFLLPFGRPGFRLGAAAVAAFALGLGTMMIESGYF